MTKEPKEAYIGYIERENPMELFEKMSDLFDEWIGDKIDSLIMEYDWSQEDMTPQAIIEKLHNEMGEEGLPDFYSRYHSLRYDMEFNTYLHRIASDLI